MGSENAFETRQGRGAAALSALERALLDIYQRDFPLETRPFARIAREQGVSEAEVLACYERLSAENYISRIGAVLKPHRAGWSTLAALAVPEARLEDVADLVSAYPEVNHNYEREHEINLWFVVTAPDRDRVMNVLAEIAEGTGLTILDLPLEESFRLDLGFPIRWQAAE
jgi:DNA-binding Lrp family transcriptional regulator